MNINHIEKKFPTDGLNVSNIVQNDGNVSIASESDSCVSSDYETDDEVDPIITPAILTPVPNQTLVQGQPIQLEVETGVEKQTLLTLCMMLNARSLYNKSEHFKNLLHQIGPEITIVSETWERQKQSLENQNSLKFYLTKGHR